MVWVKCLGLWIKLELEDNKMTKNILENIT